METNKKSENINVFNGDNQETILQRQKWRIFDPFCCDKGSFIHSKSYTMWAAASQHSVDTLPLPSAPPKHEVMVIHEYHPPPPLLFLFGNCEFDSVSLWQRMEELSLPQLRGHATTAKLFAWLMVPPPPKHYHQTISFECDESYFYNMSHIKEKWLWPSNWMGMRAAEQNPFWRPYMLPFLLARLSLWLLISRLCLSTRSIKKRKIKTLSPTRSTSEVETSFTSFH